MNYRFSLILISLLIFISCDKEDIEKDTDPFDRSEMLNNYANNIIIPAFNDLDNGISDLKLSVELFIGDVNEVNLVSLQEKWKEVYRLWQYTNAYNFGPAGAEGLSRGLSEEIATFPVSSTKIENALSSPSFNDFNRDTRGFLTIEYLIFDIDGINDNIINAFSSQERKDYLLGVVNNIESRVDLVVSGWSGNYLNDFLSNNGTDAGSSVSLLYNEFVKSFEAVKNIKIELPLGKRPGQVQIEPHLVEAYYSGISLDVLGVQLESIENLWYGKNKEGVKGLGFIDYLNSVEGGKELVASTIDQWGKVKLAFNAISKTIPLSNQIENSPELIEPLRVELQKHTRFFKSDMSSRLGISITFSSSDGD